MGIPEEVVDGRALRGACWTFFPRHCWCPARSCATLSAGVVGGIWLVSIRRLSSWYNDSLCREAATVAVGVLRWNPGRARTSPRLPHVSQGQTARRVSWPRRPEEL